MSFDGLSVEVCFHVRRYSQSGLPKKARGFRLLSVTPTVVSELDDGAANYRLRYVCPNDGSDSSRPTI